MDIIENEHPPQLGLSRQFPRSFFDIRLLGKVEIKRFTPFVFPFGNQMQANGCLATRTRPLQPHAAISAKALQSDLHDLGAMNRTRTKLLRGEAKITATARCKTTSGDGRSTVLEEAVGDAEKLGNWLDWWLHNGNHCWLRWHGGRQERAEILRQLVM